MKEFWKYMIAAGVYAVIVVMLVASCVVFGPFALLVIPGIAAAILVSLLIIAGIKESVIDPIGRKIFRRYGRRWDL